MSTTLSGWLKARLVWHYGGVHRLSSHQDIGSFTLSPVRVVGRLFLFFCGFDEQGVQFRAGLRPILNASRPVKRKPLRGTRSCRLGSGEGKPAIRTSSRQMGIEASGWSRRRTAMVADKAALITGAKSPGTGRQSGRPSRRYGCRRIVGRRVSGQAHFWAKPSLSRQTWEGSHGSAGTSYGRLDIAARTGNRERGLCAGDGFQGRRSSEADRDRCTLGGLFEDYATWDVARCALPPMVARGGGTFIITIGSFHPRLLPPCSISKASKAGLCVWLKKNPFLSIYADFSKVSPEPTALGARSLVRNAGWDEPGNRHPTILIGHRLGR